MFLRKSIHKTKQFFHKKMRNLKSLLFSPYHKLARAPSFSVLPSRKNKIEIQQLEDLYKDISEDWEPDHHDDHALIDTKRNDLIITKDTMSEGYASNGSLIVSQEEKPKEEKKKTGSWHEERRKRGSFSIENGKERGYILVEKMKELEMIDECDRDHVLDVEEVLHHYSRLTCPAYLDIVDKFFMDMYSEFLLPQPSASINKPMRRLNSMRL